MPVAKALLWLSSGNAPMVQYLYRQLLCFLAFLIERRTPWLRAASADFLQAPLPRGKKRTRRLSKHLKDAIAQAAADRSVAPSGARVLQQMHRWKGVLKRIRCGHANLNVWGHLAAYWTAAQTLATRVQRPAFGLAWDATRVDGKEMLFSALFFCSLLKGFWLPPQARVFVFCGRNTDAQNTQKTS